LISLSPTIFERSKLVKMMKKYAFVRPSVQRYRSPEIRNNTFYIRNRITDVSQHHFDLDEAKRKIFSNKIKRERPNKPSLTALVLPTRH